jgi:hypothetical protein
MSALIPDGLLANAKISSDAGPGRIYVRIGNTDDGMDFVKAFQLWRDLGKALETAWLAEGANNMSFRPLINVQEAEVAWYEKNGKHKDRVARDSRGQRYVIGDASWNNRHPSREEMVESKMGLAITRAATEVAMKQEQG